MVENEAYRGCKKRPAQTSVAQQAKQPRVSDVPFKGATDAKKTLQQQVKTQIRPIILDAKDAIKNENNIFNEYILPFCIYSLLNQRRRTYFTDLTS